MVFEMSDLSKGTTLEENKNFRGYVFIWFGQSISILGSSIVQFAIIWWLTVQTGSSIVLAVATFVGLVPMILITPFAGVLTDRWNIKSVLLITDFLQALATLGLISLFMLDVVEVWHVFGLLAIRGAMQAFQLPAGLSIVSLMVPKEKIPKVNALNSILNSLIFIASPGLGALSLEVFQVEQILWLDVFTFLPAAFAIFIVYIPRIRKSNELNSEKPSFVNEFKEGLSYIKSSGLIPILAVFAIMNFVINPIFSLIPLFITEYHGGDALNLAFIQMLFHCGILIGSFLLATRKNYKPNVQHILIVDFFLLVSLLLFGLVPAGDFLLLNLIVLFTGTTIALIDVQFISLLQIIVPQELQGRVFSSGFTLLKSILPIGLIFVGTIAELISIQFVFIACPLAGLIIALFVYQFGSFEKLAETQNGIYEKVTSESISPQAVPIVE